MNPAAAHATVSTERALPVSATSGTRPPRLASIDLLRGLDVLLMLFVNEMAGVHGTPAWLRHVPPQADGMTITDTVFPAFLFITGLAIPFALGGRIGRGEPLRAVWRHVLTRSAALIVIGVFMVNAEDGGIAGLLSVDLWTVLMTIAVLLVWRASSAEGPRSRDRLRRWVGLAMLVALALLYRSAGGTGLVQMRPQWWGILGLIGWAYLVAAAVYLWVGARPIVLACTAALLYGVFFLDRLAGIPGAGEYFDVGSVLGSHAALVLSGTVPSVVLLRARARGAPLSLVGWQVLGFGAALVVAGLGLHQFRDVSPAFWINKPMATPAWCLISAGLTAGSWAVLLFLVDVKGWRRWPSLVAVAGENALLIYLLAPLLASVIDLSAPLFGGGNPYAELGRSLFIGTVRSMVFAWAVVRLSAVMRARGLGLQL